MNIHKLAHNLSNLSIATGTSAASFSRLPFLFFTLIAVGCALVWSLTNLGFDGEYQIAMCYRLLQGDKMFLEMWEPHQTSAFLPAALMWIYLSLTETTTGIVVYLQICGILIRGGLAFLLYRTLRDVLSAKLSYGIALLYFMIAPKDYALPEFSNLQLWFSTLLFCSLWAYLKTARRYLLVLSALCLCLDVLAYPSCGILFPGVVLLLIRYSPRCKRDILLITGVCAASGIAVGSYFLLRIGPETLVKCISGMLSLEPTHTTGAMTRILNYGKDVLQQFLILVATGIVGFVLSLLPRLAFRRKGKKYSSLLLWLLCCFLVLFAGFFANIISASNRYAYSVILIFLTILGFLGRNSLDQKEKKLYTCASVIGSLEFLATLLLSDLPFSVSVPYGLLMALAALIPLEKQVIKPAAPKTAAAFHCCYACFIMLLAFRCLYIRTPLTGTEQISPTLPGISIAKSGPAIGLISDEIGINRQEESYAEWQKWIRPGDRVWIISNVVDTLGYLYADVEIACPSTISTPSFNDAILKYWELNPHKFPNVVIAESYMGNVSPTILSNQWLMNWLQKSFPLQQIIDGKYWRYYFAEPR